MPYWYCSQGQRPTNEWLDSRIKAAPKMWTQARIAKARGEAGRYARCFDCVGLIKGYLWIQPDGSLKMSAKQDKTADGMRAASNPQPISTLPEIPGVLVFCSGHVGVYIGNGRVIEAYGFKNVANRPLSAQKWTTWGKCPFILYPTAPAQQKPAQRPTGGDTGVLEIDAIADEVILGKWGVGDDRKKRLAAAGYDAAAVQARVNETLRK